MEQFAGDNYWSMGGPLAPMPGDLGGIGSRVQASLVAAMLAAPAALVLAASPIAVASTGQNWVHICGGEGSQWIWVAGGPPRPRDAPPGEHGNGLCAHAACPTEQKRGAKPAARS